MVNRIDSLFEKKRKNLLSIYFTAGFPKLQDTGTILMSLQAHGADMVEIGMPYSDPLADGPVIQHSSSVAIHNGITIEKLFSQIKELKEKIRIPLILMGYLNPVLQYGMEAFCRQAHEAGIDGVILPDLPLSDYEKEYRPVFKKWNLHLIFLVTPETSTDRIRKMDSASGGFLYAVSSTSITGVDKNLGAQEKYFKRLQAMKLRNPVMIGFGIKDHRTFTEACKYASGAIVGTAYIKTIENSVSLDKDTREFIKKLK